MSARRTAATTAAGLALALLTGSACERPAASYETTAFAMGTVVNLRAVAADEATARRASEAALASIRACERVASYENPASELNGLNRGGAAGPVAVSPALFDVVAVALKAARDTGGWFDPTIGPVVDLYGVKTGTPHFPDDAELAPARALVDYRGVVADPENRTLAFARPGMKLDLSAVAKGWAVDRAAAAMKAAGATAGIVEAGGEVVCFGGGPRPGRAWRVGIKHPRAPGLYGSFDMTAGACATSGDYEQRYAAGGRTFSHLFDPFSGRPTATAAGVTVVAASCAEADAWATALAVMPADKAAAMIKRPGGPQFLIFREVQTGTAIYASPAFPVVHKTAAP